MSPRLQHSVDLLSAELGHRLRVNGDPRLERRAGVPQCVFRHCCHHLFVVFHGQLDSADINVAREGHLHSFRSLPVNAPAGITVLHDIVVN